MKNTIETEIWVPHEEKKGMIRYVGQRKAKDVFLELEKALEQEKMCPSEGLSLGYMFAYEGVELFPQMYDLHCYAQWGSNEGIYIEIDVLTRVDGERDYRRINFAFGKDLGESEADFDRMQYIAGYIYRLFMGDGSVRSRYIMIPGEPEKSHKGLLNRAESEMMEVMKRKLFFGEDLPGQHAEELALKLMILKTLAKCRFPEDKIKELFEQENVLDFLYPICHKIMEANDFEIEDILMSCKSFESVLNAEAR